VNPDNAKLYNYRDDLDDYEYYKPAATKQSNPYIYRDDLGQYLLWDDDRWDIPSQSGRLQNRDIFAAQMGIVPEAIYISPVIDAGATSAWYLLSWWAATEHSDQVLFQTRFGISGAGEPPKDGSEGNGWTAWTGNPGGIYPDPPFNGCEAGTGCYYDAPGRYIVGHEGNHWPEYRFLQYKAIIRQTGTGGTHPFKTAISQVTIHYEGPEVIYLPTILRGP
jgi:hypothetical protein